MPSAAAPSKNGSTAILAAEAARGLVRQGIEQRLSFLDELRIKGCQTCYGCKKNEPPDCSVNDDMQLVTG